MTVTFYLFHMYVYHGMEWFLGPWTLDLWVSTSPHPFLTLISSSIPILLPTPLSLSPNLPSLPHLPSSTPLSPSPSHSPYLRTFVPSYLPYPTLPYPVHTYISYSTFRQSSKLVTFVTTVAFFISSLSTSTLTPTSIPGTLLLLLTKQ